MTADVIADLDEGDYHAHPALSASGAKLLARTCPAVFRWQQDNRRPEKRAFDFGHLAHRLILGAGSTIRVLDHADYRTRAAQDARDTAYAAEEVPALRSELLRASRMAREARQHPIAGPLFADGTPELSIIWTDETWHVQRRARLDWITQINGRVVIVDYKTSTTADPEHLGRKFADYGYHQQHAWYLDAAKAAGFDDPGFLFVVQEKEPPYVVTVVELNALAVSAGRAANARALETFAQCTAAGVWPGYSTDIALIGLPAWATRETFWETA